MTAARLLNCPSCGGALEVKAAGYSISVACRYCGALLDVADPDVKLITQYHEILDDLPLPLGSRGALFDVEWEVIGALKRSDADTSWHELLLFNPYAGYRWLVRSDDGWQYGSMLADQPVDTGRTQYDGDEEIDQPICEWRDQDYVRDYEPQQTTTDRVVGEFYWRVEVGDTVSACTYSRGDEVLSIEASQDEVNWTQLVPLDGDDVTSAFSPQQGPSGKPARRVGGGGRKRAKGASSGYGERVFGRKEGSGRGDLSMMLFMATVAAILILAIMIGFGMRSSFFEGTATVVVDAPEKTVTLGSLTASRPQQFVTISTRSSAFDNRWVDIDYSLVDRSTQRSIDAYAVVERYSGYDSDGSWSEGSGAAKTLVAEVPRGTYDIVADISAHHWSPYSSAYDSYSNSSQQPAFYEEITLFVRAKAGGMSWGNYLAFLVLLYAAPLFIIFHRYRSSF